VCEKCPLRTTEYFVRDRLTGIDFGIKASVCELLNLVNNRLKEVKK